MAQYFHKPLMNTKIVDYDNLQIGFLLLSPIFTSFHDREERLQPSTQVLATPSEHEKGY